MKKIERNRNEFLIFRRHAALEHRENVKKSNKLPLFVSYLLRENATPTFMQATYRPPAVSNVLLSKSAPSRTTAAVETESRAGKLSEITRTSTGYKAR